MTGPWVSDEKPMFTDEQVVILAGALSNGIDSGIITAGLALTYPTRVYFKNADDPEEVACVLACRRLPSQLDDDDGKPS